MVVDFSFHCHPCHFTKFTAGVTDTIDPVIVNCPTDITQTVAAGQTSAAVTWTPPTATDDTTPTGQVVSFTTHSPGQQFPVGTTPVSYIFRDLAGNEATCSFNVIVQSELCIVFLLYESSNVAINVICFV